MAKRASDTYCYRPRHYLLTRNELSFYRALRQVLGRRWLIFAKVRLADIVVCPDSQWRKAPGRRIAQKHLDFVVCHPETLRIIAAIELDDRSHAQPARRRRDGFVDSVFRAARIPLLRYKARTTYDVADLIGFWQATQRPK